MPLTTDVFLVSYPDHYAGLPALFRSIEKFVIGFRRVVLVIEEADPAPDVLAFVEIKRCRNYRDYHACNYWGRGGQQIEKLRAWHYTDAERVIYVDSDLVFVRPVDVQTDPCISLEKPLVIWRMWKDAGEARKWYLPTKMVLRFEPPGECMARFPFVFPRWFLQEYWRYMGEITNSDEWLQVFAHPQEFNGLGNYAMARHADKFTLLRVGVDALPETCIYQYSIPKRTPADVAELERLGLLPKIPTLEDAKEFLRQGKAPWGVVESCRVCGANAHFVLFDFVDPLGALISLAWARDTGEWASARMP